MEFPDVNVSNDGLILASEYRPMVQAMMDDPEKWDLELFGPKGLTAEFDPDHLTVQQAIFVALASGVQLGKMMSSSDSLLDVLDQALASLEREGAEDK